MLVSSIEHGLSAGSCEAVPAIRGLSPSIAFKRILLAVDLTVSLPHRDTKCLVAVSSCARVWLARHVDTPQALSCRYGFARKSVGSIHDGYGAIFR